MISLCNIFEESSSFVKNWLEKQPEVKEESITDWFLFNLSEQTPTIRYKQFTRSEEGRKTGADWEWWFVFSENESFASRVQAKKLKQNYDNYSGIAYVSGDKLQIDRLLDDSSKEDFASFYAFYTTEKGKSAGCKNFLNSNSGVFISEANNLREQFILKGKRRIESKDIIKYSNPISCFFCCPMLLGTDDIASGFRRHVQTYFPTVSDNLANNNIIRNGFRKTPNEILSFIGEVNIPEWWENEYRYRFEKVNSILVVDLRSEKNR